MFLAINLIAVVWIWFQYGFPFSCAVLAISFVVYLLLSRQTAVFFLVFGVLIVFHLENEFKHVLPKYLQHSESELTVCSEQKLKNYNNNMATGYARVIEQPEYLDLRRIKISIYQPFTEQVSLETGACFHGIFRLRMPLGRLIPGAFNSDRYYFANNVDALATLTDIDFQSFQPDSQQRLYNKQYNRFESESALAIWSALTLGWSTSMPSELKTLIANNQLMHLFVISGMHIGFFAGFIMLMIGLLSRYTSAFVVFSGTQKGIACLALLAAYVALLGFPVPATRAFIMFSLPVYAFVSAHRISITKSLIVTVILVTLWQPESWLQMGTWLSFVSAVLLILLSQWPPVRNRKFYIQAIIIQLVLSVAIIPWAVIAGLTINPASLATNFMVTPVVAFVMLPLAFLIMVFPELYLQTLFDWLSSLIVRLLEWGVGFGQSLPYAEVAFVLLIVVLMISIVWSGRVQGLLTGLISATVIVFLFFGPAFSFFRSEPEDTKISFLDVGHGLSVLFETAHESLLYDTGGMFNPEKSLYDVSLKRMMPKLDAIVISHSDSDHAAGAVQLHYDQSDVPVWAGEPDKIESVISVNDCHRHSLNLESFSFVTTPVSMRNSDNNRSCILKYEHKGKTLLITGDADKYLEYYLLQAHPELFPLSILVLGHHGSNSSSATDWLNANRSALIINSSGDRLMPRWPSKRILSWFKDSQKELLTTSESGTIELTLSENAIRISESSSGYRQRLLNRMNHR